MPVNAAQLMVTVGANTAAAEQGIMGFARLLGPGGILGLGALGAAAAIAGIGIASTKMAGDFQSGMVSIVTGAGESRSNLQMISDGVLQMARDTGTSTSQLTAGLYMIESGGYHGAAGLKILQAAAEGAKVGNADLGTVADATDTILKNYGSSSFGASQAVNTLITTVANGKTHMEDLAAALAHILPTGAAAGVGLNDVMGAMATMTGEGVDAANAATYLRQMMIALMAPSHASEQALGRIGLTTAQVADEMHKSLPGAVQMITDAIGKKFPVGSAGYMQAIRDISGGSRQMQGMLLLSGRHMATFNEDVKKIGGTVKASGDTINGWALVQTTFNQHLAILGETVKTLMIQLGTHLLPVATQLADLFAHGLTSAVDMLTGKNKQLTPIIQLLGSLFTQVVVPILRTFWSVLQRDVMPVVENLAHIIVTKWLPPIIRMYKDILPVLNPLLQLLGWVLGNVVGPVLGQVGGLIGFLLGKLADLFDLISRFVQSPAVQSFFKMVGGDVSKGLNAIGGALNSLPHFAAGGMMDASGLALVGEAGPEIVRLPGGTQVTPIAQMAGGPLAPVTAGYGGSGGQMTIVVNLKADGRQLAQVVVPHIHTVIRNATGQRAM